MAHGEKTKSKTVSPPGSLETLQWNKKNFTGQAEDAENRILFKVKGVKAEKLIHLQRRGGLKRVLHMRSTFIKDHNAKGVIRRALRLMKSGT